MEMLLIPIICAHLITSTSPQYSSACNSAITATYLQEEDLHDNIQLITQDVNKRIQVLQRKAEAKLGKSFIATATTVYTLEVSKSLILTIPGGIIADTISLNANQSSGNLLATWTF